jgi:cysteine synthase A
MLPDTGERYLSTPLFDGISDEMNGEETGISRSTPGHRFDVSTPAPSDEQSEGGSPPPVRTEPRPIPPLDEDAVRFVRETVSSEPVVMFALEWCEFCWSARKLFDALGIAYASIDLDSVDYQQDERGGKIRAVLAEWTGSPTIPQIYVGGELIGGCTELFDAHGDGSLRHRLDRLGVEHHVRPELDAYTLLPGWLHPRKAG